jgi:diphosphomevalonate decarboxylase
VGSAATAQAHPNLALVKYWGNRDPGLRLPANGSISISLGSFWTRTRVEWREGGGSDEVSIEGRPSQGQQRARVVEHLDRIRGLAGITDSARVASQSNFPASAGLASSASAFAALTLAACSSAGLGLTEAELSRLARRGSGSAARSIPGGFVEWFAGTSDGDSYATSLAPPWHWSLVDLVAIVSRAPKATGSTEGHARAATSPLQSARVENASSRLEECRKAILDRDMERLAFVAELDSNLMHAVMVTSRPALHYLHGYSIGVMQAVSAWRQAGTPVFYSVDAGPNVHCVTEADHADDLAGRIARLEGVLEVLQSGVGGAAAILDEPG